MTPGTRNTINNQELFNQRRPMNAWGVHDGALHFGSTQALSWDEAQEVLGFVAEPARAQALLAEIDAEARSDADAFPLAIVWRHAVRAGCGFNKEDDFGATIVQSSARLADEPRLVRNFLTRWEARVLEAVINSAPHVAENRVRAAMAMR